MASLTDRFRREFGQLSPERYDVAYSLQVHRLVEKAGGTPIGKIVKPILMPSPGWWQQNWTAARTQAVAGTEDAQTQRDRGGPRGTVAGSWPGRDVIPTTLMATVQGVFRLVPQLDPAARTDGSTARQVAAGYTLFRPGRSGPRPVPVRVKQVDRGQVSPAFAALPRQSYRGVEQSYK